MHQRDPSSIHKWGYWIPVFIETGDEIRSEDENNPHLEKKQGFKLVSQVNWSWRQFQGQFWICITCYHHWSSYFFIRSMVLASLWPATCDCQHWFYSVSLQGCNLWWRCSKNWKVGGGLGSLKCKFTHTRGLPEDLSPLLAGTQYEQQIKCSTGLNPIARRCSTKEMFSIFCMTPKLWWKLYISFLHQFFKEIKLWCNAYNLPSLAHWFKFRLFSQILILFCNGWKRECNSQATSSSKEGCRGRTWTCNFSGKKGTYQSFQVSLSNFFQPSCLEEGTWKPQQSSLGDIPLPIFPFFHGQFFF